MLAEKEIRTNATSLVAVTTWIVSLLIWGIGWVTDQRYVAVLAVIVCGAAITATIRSYFIAQTEQIRTALMVTDRDRPRDVTRLR